VNALDVMKKYREHLSFSSSGEDRERANALDKLLAVVDAAQTVCEVDADAHDWSELSLALAALTEDTP
jgi:hypothetical protein